MEKKGRENIKKYKLKEFFVNKIYRLNTLILFLIWGSSCFSYYFVEFYMKYVPVTSIFILSLMIGLADLTGSLSLLLLKLNWVPK
jgi:hypothetical protein